MEDARVIAKAAALGRNYGAVTNPPAEPPIKVYPETLVRCMWAAGALMLVTHARVAAKPKTD